MKSCLYEGRVYHTRFAPLRHVFGYRIFLCYLDLDELDTTFAGRTFWSVEAPNLASFYRSDHLGDPRRPLADCVRELVHERLGRRPTGPIRLLTHLRYFGYVMNPVSFYYCWDEDETCLEAIVAEVHNTPWGERHCYVLDAARGGAPLRYRFEKSFHVSPFFPMEQEYDWRFREPGEELFVRMQNFEAGQRVFTATMQLARLPITARTLRRALWRFPLMTVQVVAGIYWQALKLHLRGVRYFPHPRTRLRSSTP